MIWALLSIYIFGGKSAVDGFFLVDVKKELRATVADPVRVEKILRVRKQIKVELKDAYKFYDQEYKQIGEINRRHDARDEEFREIKMAITERRRQTQKYLLDKRFEMRSLMAREEWEQVFSKSQ